MWGATVMKTTKLFKNGNSQAVRLPKEFRFKNNEVFIKKVGRAVILTPVKNAWDSLFKSLDKFSEDFMVSREQPETQMREAL